MVTCLKLRAAKRTGTNLKADSCHETVEAGQTIEAITPMTPVYSEDMSCRNWIFNWTFSLDTRSFVDSLLRILGCFSICVPLTSTAPPRELSLALGELLADRFPPEIYAEIGNQRGLPSLQGSWNIFKKSCCDL